MWQEFLSLFKAPVTGLKEPSEKEKLLTIFIKMGVISLITSFLVLFRLLILNGSLGSNSAFKMMFGSSAEFMKIGGGAIFGMMVLSLVLFAGFIALVAVTIMLIGRIFKSKISYKTSLALATNYSYMLGIAFILGFITSLFSLILTLIILVAGFLYYDLVLTTVVKNMLNVEKENKLFWVTFGMKMALIACITLIVWIATRIVGADFSKLFIAIGMKSIYKTVMDLGTKALSSMF
jgi:hypothetical protein